MIDNKDFFSDGEIDAGVKSDGHEHAERDALWDAGAPRGAEASADAEPDGVCQCDGTPDPDGHPCAEEEYVPENKIESAMLYVYRNEQLGYSLRIASSAIVILTVYALLYDLVVALSQSNFYWILTVLVSTGVPFLAVTVLRKLMDAPRPYEVLTFFETPPRAKRGQSFPSRHVFSVFVIGSVLCFSNLFVGILLLVAGAVLSLVRVLLGYHFVRDVVAGGLIGVLSGVVGALIFALLG